MKAFKWWDEQPLPQGIQWLALEHNGIFFAPDYQPHGVKMRYDGKDVDLPPELEEVCACVCGCACVCVCGPQGHGGEVWVLGPRPWHGFEAAPKHEQLMMSPPSLHIWH
jgi:hypothetical protein